MERRAAGSFAVAYANSVAAKRGVAQDPKPVAEHPEVAIQGGFRTLLRRELGSQKRCDFSRSSDSRL